MPTNPLPFRVVKRKLELLAFLLQLKKAVISNLLKEYQKGQSLL